MHEYSIIAALMKQVEAHAAANGASSVVSLSVSIGELSGVDTYLLSAAWETFRERTICEEARLDIRTVEARWKCTGCGREILRGQILQCPDCGFPARLSSGDEILLERIEMEVANV